MGNAVNSCADCRTIEPAHEVSIAEPEREDKIGPPPATRGAGGPGPKLGSRSEELAPGPGRPEAEKLSAVSQQDKRVKQLTDICPSEQTGSSVSRSAVVAKKSFPNGGSYVGDCDAQGVPHGRGRYVSPAREEYEGEFFQGKLQGRGSMSDAQGNRYSGGWFENRRHGQGIERLASGDTYEGQFALDRREGFGNPRSPGALYLASGATYTGYFLDNCFHGQGTFVWPRGRQTYEGAWRHGKMEGRGRLVLESGAVFHGEFRDNMKHGPGTLTQPGGATIRGVWAEDRLVQQGEQTPPESQA